MRALVSIISIAGSLGGCLSVPDGPTPECDETSDCDAINGEVCDLGVCWGNPPPGPFAATVTPPSERKNEIVMRELDLAAIAPDGDLGDIQLEQPVIVSGTIRCPLDCADTTALSETTIVVSRSSAAFFRNGPGFRQVIVAEPRTGTFTLVLPSARPDEPFTLTVIPGGRDEVAPTTAQVVPPLQMRLSVAQLGGSNALDIQLARAVTPSSTVTGNLRDYTGAPLGGYRIVALGRFENGAALSEVSTVDYTSGSGARAGEFTLQLSEGVQPAIEIVATPPGPLVGPVLRLAANATTGLPQTMTLPDVGSLVPVGIQVRGAGTGGDVTGVNGARVTISGRIAAAQPGQAETTFTTEATTDTDGTATVMLLDGDKLQDDYRISVVPPAGSNVGVLFGRPFSFTAPVMMLPDRVALVGKVSDFAGKPLQDVQVTVRPSLRFQWSLASAPQAFIAAIPAPSAVTPDTGEFVVYVDEALETVLASYDIMFEPASTARAPQWVEYDVGVPTLASDQSSVELPEILLPDAAHVRGVITDPSGSPIEGAELRLFSHDGPVDPLLCSQLPHAPLTCPIPARLLGHGAATALGAAELTLPRR